MFGSMAESFKSWDKSGLCQFPGCDARSIPRSHTLQKGGPLKCIAISGHVIAPELDFNTGEYRLGRIGLSEASTFPGFCPKHEMLFFEFENRGTLVSVRDAVLQMYRSVSRDAVRIRFDIAHHQRFDAQFRKLWLTKFRSLLQPHVSSLVQAHPILKDYGLALPREEESRLATWLRRAELDLKSLQKTIVDVQLAVNALDRGTVGMRMHRYLLPIRLPVALSGQSAINLIVGGEDVRVLVFLVVVPEPNQTQVFIASSLGDGRHLDWFLRKLGLLQADTETNADTLTSFIESFMLYGTDHWFVDQAFWNSLRADTLRTLLDEIGRDDVLINKEPPFPFLPRPPTGKAVRAPISGLRMSAWDSKRAARMRAGWNTHLPLKDRLAARLLSSRKRRALSYFKDTYNGDIHVFTRNARDGGWVLARTLRSGRWTIPWTRMMWSQIAPFGS